MKEPNKDFARFYSSATFKPLEIDSPSMQECAVREMSRGLADALIERHYETPLNIERHIDPATGDTEYKISMYLISKKEYKRLKEIERLYTEIRTKG